jgi:hypothetical protein
VEKVPANIYRYLISSTSRFIGEYDSELFNLDHVWPNSEIHADLLSGLQESHHSRNYYMLSMKIGEPGDEKKSILIREYSFVAQQVCNLLCVLFGKRFDYNGSIISHGDFHRPSLMNHPPINYYYAPTNSHSQRVDTDTRLMLNSFSLIEPLLINNEVSKKVRDTMRSASRFYARSVRVCESDPELAYLDLVACCEFLMGFYEEGYTNEEIFNKEQLADFLRIEREIAGGHKLARKLKSSMRQISKKYLLTALRLLTEQFFEKTESVAPYGALTRVEIEGMLKAAYNLRSLYVHTGATFRRWIDIGQRQMMYERHPRNNGYITESDIDKEALKAPTYIGLERIVRYCLLRFLHLNGVPIDTRLDGEGLNTVTPHVAPVEI